MTNPILPSVTTTTLSSNPNNWLIQVVFEDAGWFVSERGSNVYGSGSSLLHALIDFWTALGSTLAVLDDEQLSHRLELEVEEIRRLLRVVS